MSVDIAYREIWIPIDVNGNAEAVSLSGDIALMFKGGETMFRLALFDTMPKDVSDPGVFRNHANLATFLLKIRSSSYAGTLLLDSSSGGDISLDATVTEAQFVAKQAAPISIYCPNAITAISATSLYMTFSGSTNDKPAQIDGFGRGRITVEDIGLGLSDSVAPAGPTAATTDLVNALFNQCVKYGLNPAGKTVTFQAPTQPYGRTIGCDDNGDLLSNQENL